MSQWQVVSQDDLIPPLPAQGPLVEHPSRVRTRGVVKRGTKKTAAGEHSCGIPTQRRAQVVRVLWQGTQKRTPACNDDVDLLTSQSTRQVSRIRGGDSEVARKDDTHLQLPHSQLKYYAVNPLSAITRTN